MTVNQDVVGSSPTVGARMRADDKSHLLFCCFSDIYSLAVNQDGVGERSENYPISQSQLSLTALFTKESLAVRPV